MQLQVRTLLNKLHPLKHHVYASTALIDRPKGPEIHVTIVPRKNSLARCADCLRPGSTYDHQLERTWRFVPLWALAVILIYVPRRVSCGNCNRVVIEHMSWSCGKSDVADVYMSFLATWASRLSWAETARIFGVSWQCVRSSIARVVTYGLEHRNLDGISAIGVDEICYRVGQKFITLVYQVDAGSRRLLWICDTRKEKAFTAFFTWFGEQRSAALEVVCSDMWAPYLKVIRLKAGGALNVLDKFHIVKHLNEGVDETRRRDAAELRKQGEDVTLKHSRWCLLKRPANLTANQRGRLASLLKLNLRTARAYILKEEFNHFWTYTSPTWAGKFLDRWCEDTMRSGIEPMKAKARMLRNHRDLILNYFRAKKAYSSGVVEGLNNKLRTVTKRSFGFRELDTLKLALFHTMGKLPEPEHAHRFA